MARRQPPKVAATNQGLVRAKESAEPSGELLLYETDDGRTRVECRFADETLWLSQALMAGLFQTTPQNVTLHLRALFQEQDIDEAATCKDYLQVRVEGGREVSRTFPPVIALFPALIMCNA